jgi:hypothetical protein
VSAKVAARKNAKKFGCDATAEMLALWPFEILGIGNQPLRRAYQSGLSLFAPAVEALIELLSSNGVDAKQGIAGVAKTC